MVRLLGSVGQSWVRVRVRVRRALVGPRVRVRVRRALVGLRVSS